ncbi:hypothetical protein E1J38_002385 [Seonamhaeicola sediminis]|uniref:Uncharacterized protein n=1 Tax=Seonamhaeicola sediminis TaxID=2528206 RepID=A0A562YJ46_9FLAO|nr:hypothetical protein [Seonamhaeicola sediminis]TWO34727.1 hypothetical protein E1J38_002385 [Seonamhaeicola sediminis]
MTIRTDIQNKISQVLNELEDDIEETTKEATIILRYHRGKLMKHLNNDTLDSEEFIESEEKWDNIDNKLKSLNQIKKILVSHKNNHGVIEDLEALDKELTEYVDIANEKKLHIIEETFRYYGDKLPKEDTSIEDLIKLKIKESSNSQFIKETFLKACQNLDASIFEPLIDEDQYFEELDKYRFLQSMKEQFDYLKEIGVEKVHIAIGTCKMCYTGEKVYEFYKEPKKGKPAFAYNIQEKDGNIKDIFRCNFSDGYERDARNNRDPDIEYLF